MKTVICNVCRGRGRDTLVECPECEGTRFDTSDPDNPTAQCTNCCGEGVIEVDECHNCGGEGFIEIEDDHDDEEE